MRAKRNPIQSLHVRYRWMRRWLPPATMLQLAIVGVVFLVGTVLAENQNRSFSEQAARARVQAELGLIRARIEGRITGDVRIAQGLVAVLETEPDMDQERFSMLAASVLRQDTDLRHIAAAPDLTISMIYPLEGNEEAIGLDYTANAAQREAAISVRNSGTTIIAGPIELVQGGEALVARIPVMLPDADGGDPSFWGLLAVVIDAEELYTASGLFEEDSSIDIAIRGADGLGMNGAHFFGPESLFWQNPVTAEVTLPTGYWEIAAVPKGGWSSFTTYAWITRGLALLAALMVAVPIFLGGLHLRERRRHVVVLEARERELQRISRRLGVALQTSRIGIWELNITNGELFWDDRVNQIFGFPMDGATRGYRDWRSALHPEDLERAEEEFRVAVEETGQYFSDYRVKMKDGEVRHVRAIGAVYADPGADRKIVGVNWDVTRDVELNTDLSRAKAEAEARYDELEDAKAKIEHNSLHDALTGLPNRRYLDAVLEGLKDRDYDRLAVLHVDLDRFKQINDTLGHPAGDAMLVHVAGLLRENADEADFVARIGGDEFVVICVDGPNADDPADLAQRLIDQGQQPISYENHECRFGISVGIVMGTMRSDVSQMMLNADIALYRAKSRGRNRLEFFSGEMQAQIVKTKRVADEILSGLERNEFVAWYQPQFHARTRELAGVEALARWNHPTEGVLAPATFIDVAEDLNVLAKIDRIILEQTLEQIKVWDSQGLRVPHASVNVSGRRLHDDALIEGLKTLDIEPGRIAFEFVESIYLDKSDDIVSWNIDQIRDLGIDIELDDFGTGYASVISLMNLRPSRLKIDRQLVMPIVESRTQRQLVRSIIDIGKALGIRVVAEGVESQAHADVLRDLGCDYIQGFAFARPMRASDLEGFLMARAWRVAG